LVLLIAINIMRSFSFVIPALLLAAALSASASASTARGPIDKVVTLLEELKSKIEADGKMEQEVYDKYACWCEETTARKAHAIEEGRKAVARLGNQVLEFKGKIATRTAEIAKLTKDIAENEKSQAKATEVRQKESAAFMAERTEMGQAINALERAIKVLSNAGRGKKEMLQQGDIALLRIATDLRGAVEHPSAQKKLSKKKLALVSQFVQHPAELVQQLQNNKYSPASTTITGILKDMYDQFTADLESKTEIEAQTQKAFEDLMAELKGELINLKEMLQKKTAEKAELELRLADTEQELQNTSDQLADDSKFFDNVKEQCETKAGEWGERSTLRSAELEGIEKALEILTSDEAKEMFGKAIKPGMEKTMFLQMDSESEVATPAEKAFRVLKKVAKSSKSLRLAALAATLRTGGAFDKVIAQIDKMMQDLAEEGEADKENRDWCRETTFDREQEKARYEWKIEKSERKLKKLDKVLEEQKEAIEATQAQIVQTEEDLDAMKVTRDEEHEAFKTAKSDDEAAIKLLEEAIEALGAYFKDNKVEMGPIQGSVKLLQAPEFEKDPDVAPEAKFSGKGSRKNESKGIISILTMIKEDLEAEIKNGIKAEDSSNASYEKAKYEAEESIKTLQKKVDDLELAKTKTEESISDEEKNKEELETEHALVEEELERMKPNCEWLEKNFDVRAQKRTAEIDGLRQAKEYLAGATAMTQESEKSKKFDDEAFPSLGFGGLSFMQARSSSA